MGGAIIPAGEISRPQAGQSTDARRLFAENVSIRLGRPVRRSGLYVQASDSLACSRVELLVLQREQFGEQRLLVVLTGEQVHQFHSHFEPLLRRIPVRPSAIDGAMIILLGLRQSAL